MLFCCFSVGLKKSEPLLRLRLITTNRRDIACMLGASVFFLTPSLIYKKKGGAQAFPLLANNSAGLFAAYQPLSSRQRYWLAVYTQPL